MRLGPSAPEETNQVSYMAVPRICFRGTFHAQGPTRNNLLAALDQPSILGQNPHWDFMPMANADFTLTGCKVVAAWNAQGVLIVDPADDPVIGANVAGTGKMADLDPEHRRVTDLIGMNLSIGLPDDGSGAGPISVNGRLETTQLRDYWQNSSGAVVTSWQSIISKPNWAGQIAKSSVLNQLNGASPHDLSVKITPITVPNRGVNGLLVGVVGPWSPGEPKQFVAGRRLITRRASGQLPFPVASCLVDAARKKLVVDLSNMPMNPAKPDAEPLVTDLVPSGVTFDDDGNIVASAILGPSQDFNAGLWQLTAGFVEWDLTQAQLIALETNHIRLTCGLEGDPLVMEEHLTGLYVDVDCRSLRLDPGQSRDVDVYARRLGQPLVGQIVTFDLHGQTALAAVEPILVVTDVGYPPNPDRLINSEPREVLFDRPGPLQVVTDRDGQAQLTISARPGEFELPDSRSTIDSQLYFLGEPDGWQSWGAIGPNNGDLSSSRVGAGCALSVLVFNTHPAILAPAWKDVEPWLRRYAFLYPAMIQQAFLNLSDKRQVDANASDIYSRLLCKTFDDIDHMPISRDLSDFRLQTILAYLRSVMPGPPPC
jgi:hypothetical protein